MTLEKKKHLTTSDFNKALPKEVAEKFKVVNIGKRTSYAAYYGDKFGTVNFKKLSIKRAEQLVKLKFPHLEPKAKSNSEK